MSVVIESQKQLYDDVDAWCQQAGAGAADAGALDWDVTKVYDFRLLFSPHGDRLGFARDSRPYMATCNPDIGKWDVTRATNMRNMFSGNSAFTGRGLSQWDTARVGSMSFMFSGASAFDADISGWDLTRASAMGGMFTGASALSDCNKNKIAEAWTRKSKYYQAGRGPELNLGERALGFQVGPAWLDTDACMHAMNGLCQDGGDGATDDACPHGADVSDCGKRFACAAPAELGSGELLEGGGEIEGGAANATGGGGDEVMYAAPVGGVFLLIIGSVVGVVLYKRWKAKRDELDAERLRATQRKSSMQRRESRLSELRASRASVEEAEGE